jgi:transcription elongation GreA/GreB family factor
MEGRKVNLRGMVQLDQMEDFLSHLLDRITQQDKIIESLSKLLENAATKTASERKFKEIEAFLLKLSNRLDAVETASTAIVNGSR